MAPITYTNSKKNFIRYDFSATWPQKGKEEKEEGTHETVANRRRVES